MTKLFGKLKYSYHTETKYELVNRFYRGRYEYEFVIHDRGEVQSTVKPNHAQAARDKFETRWKK